MRLNLAPCLLALLFVFPTSFAAPVPPAVRVDVVENIPNEANWNFTPPDPTETYAEPAFAFVAMPVRYSSKGIKVDRSNPFLYRATAPVQLPAGEHRLLLRARTGSRLFVDGKEL